MHHGGGTIAFSRAGERGTMRISWKLIILMLLGVVLLATSAYKLRQLYQYRHTSEGLAKGFKAYEYSARRVPLEDNGWKILATVLVWSVATVLEIKRIRGTIRSLPLGEAMSRNLPQWHIVFSTMIVVCAKRILRRWRIVFATMIIVCAVGVPAIWLLTPPEFRTKAVIRVSLVPPSDSESARNIPDLDSLLKRAVHSLSSSLSSRRIIDSVAKELASENLSFFADSPILSEVEVLRNAVADEAINFIPEPSKELLTVEMISSHSDEAEVIIDAFIDSYMRSVHAAQKKVSSHKLKILLENKQSLKNKIESYRQVIPFLDGEFGKHSVKRSHDREPLRFMDPYDRGRFYDFTNPNDRYRNVYEFMYSYDKSDKHKETMPDIVARLQQALIDVIIEKIVLEAEIQVMENAIGPTGPHAYKLELQNAFINSDRTIKSLCTTTRQYERQILIDKQRITKHSAEFRLHIEMIDTFQKKLEARRQQLTEEFDAMLETGVENWILLALVEAKAELAKVIEHEKKLKEQIEQIYASTIYMTVYQFTKIADLKGVLANSKNQYKQVSRSIRKIKSEPLRLAHISIAQMARSVPLRGGKLRRSIWVLLFGLVFGFVFAAVLEIKRSKATWR